MVFRVAGSFLRKAICHIQTDYRYRYYPLYSAGLAGLFYVWVLWPWDDCVFEARWLHPWIRTFEDYAVYAVCLMAVCCGVVGLFRRGLPAKVLSFAGLYVMNWFWEPFGFVGHLTSDFLWYTFDLPEKHISGFAGLETGGATLLWCGYLLIVYLLIRPVLKRSFKGFRSIARRAVDLYPPLARLDKPVL